MYTLLLLGAPDVALSNRDVIPSASIGHELCSRLLACFRVRLCPSPPSTVVHVHHGGGVAAPARGEQTPEVYL